MNVMDQQINSNPTQVFPPPDLPLQRQWENSAPPAVAFDPRITLCLAWTVRAALLALYIPVQMMSAIVQVTHRIDLWASAIVTKPTYSQPVRRVQ
jgi:hypothetical protein